MFSDEDLASEIADLFTEAEAKSSTRIPVEDCLGVGITPSGSWLSRKINEAAERAEVRAVRAARPCYVIEPLRRTKTCRCGKRLSHLIGNPHWREDRPGYSTWHVCPVPREVRVYTAATPLFVDTCLHPWATRKRSPPSNDNRSRKKREDPCVSELASVCVKERDLFEMSVGIRSIT